MTFWHGMEAIAELEGGQRARSWLNVPQSLDVFSTHFARFPVLPGVLLLECLSQLGAALLAQTDRPWRLRSVSRVRFRHFVLPGSRLEVEVVVSQQESSRVLLRGLIHVEGRVVVTVGQLEFAPEEPV